MTITVPKIHVNQKRFYRYWYPKRLTLKTNPIKIYRWLFWVWRVNENK